ncbi:hypothetical protein FHW23_001153 [Curtobacterium pusillum]|uniref:Lactococcin 972 family bacteriocin n=1 Tax=Curtobacterium pusillum TaxID=69373 RepID=A0AAW3T630_9MICO|nr:lactococcin 972 family bacteriocin [Curtobacterium pusillum]MBA8989907.1 hypothetical protein [Curtobacterium pusillum]
MKKTAILAAAAAAAALTAGIGVSAASAAEAGDTAGAIREGSASADGMQTRNGTEYVGGGTWTYGVWDKRVHSLFLTDRSTHRASVKLSGVVTRSAWMPPTKLAYAHRAKSLSGNQAYWATRG